MLFLLGELTTRSIITIPICNQKSLFLSLSLSLLLSQLAPHPKLANLCGHEHNGHSHQLLLPLTVAANCAPLTHRLPKMRLERKSLEIVCPVVETIGPNLPTIHVTITIIIIRCVLAAAALALALALKRTGGGGGDESVRTCKREQRKKWKWKRQQWGPIQSFALASQAAFASSLSPLLH